MDMKELAERSRKKYWLSFGCIGMVWKDQQNMAIRGDVLRNYICEAIVSEGVSLVEGEYSFDYEIIDKISIGEGLGSIPRLTMPLHVSTVNVPPVIIEFESDPICAPIEETRQDKKKMKARFYYDGLVYCLALDMSDAPRDYYHNAHIRVIHERFAKVLELSKLWSIVESEEYAGQINLYVLKEGHSDSNKRDDNGVACEYSHFSTIALSYVENDKRSKSIEDALDSIAEITMSPYAREYYCCVLIRSQIEEFTTKAKTLINEITNSVLSFYELKWINIFSRYARSVEISKMAANLYPLIPHIEKLCVEYDHHRSNLQHQEPWFNDVIEKPYREVLSSRLSEKKPGFLSSTVEEMISREVSEIRSQVNYQFLLLSVLIAVIGVLGSMIIGIVS